MRATISRVDIPREREWALFFAGLTDSGRDRLREIEADAHDLFMEGELTIQEVVDFLAREHARCVVCLDEGCEFCPGSTRRLT
jgi:hypothetical protein